MDTIALTLYLVGLDEDDARGRFPFNDYSDAEDYNNAEFGGEGIIYSVTATIDFGTMERD